MKIIL
jgi:hypothetical protein